MSKNVTISARREKTTLSLIKFVTFGLGREGVKGNSDNVTEYDVFFLSPSLMHFSQFNSQNRINP